MTLKDPFGRLQQKQQSQYESLRAALQEAGVDNRDEAIRYLSNMRRNGLLMMVLVVGVAILLSTLFPGLAGIILVFAALLLIWVFSMLLNGHRFVKRFIAEEFPQ